MISNYMTILVFLALIPFLKRIFTSSMSNMKKAGIALILLSIVYGAGSVSFIIQKNNPIELFNHKRVVSIYDYNYSDKHLELYILFL